MRLKPCPFCGSGAKGRKETYRGEFVFMIRCGFCAACLWFYYPDAEKGATEAWNRRANEIDEFKRGFMEATDMWRDELKRLLGGE